MYQTWQDEEGWLTVYKKRRPNWDSENHESMLYHDLRNTLGANHVYSGNVSPIVHPLNEPEMDMIIRGGEWKATGMMVSILVEVGMGLLQNNRIYMRNASLFLLMNFLWIMIIDSCV